MASEIGAGRIGEQAAQVQVFERKTRDVLEDNLLNARDIGRVRLQSTRLNVFSALSEGDKEDNFKFAVDSRANLRLGKNADAETRIQILNNRRRVIADSKEGMGRASERFQRLLSSEGERLELGDYYIKVSRLKARDTESEHNYSLQLHMGSGIKRDFDTIEYAGKSGQGTPPSVRVPAAVSMAAGAANMLAAGMVRFSTLIDGAITVFGRIRGLLG
jgi:hypothetical protein